jgi:hypothetical protein
LLNPYGLLGEYFLSWFLAFMVPSG